MLPLTDKDPPEKPQEKDLPPCSSESKGPNPTSSKDTSDNSPSPGNKETVTTAPPEELEHVVGTPPSPHRQDSPTEYPPKENPKAPLDSEEGLGVPPTKKSQSVPPDNPFSRFWSGQTADTSDKNKKRHRWLVRKPERRHSVELQALDEQRLREQEEEDLECEKRESEIRRQSELPTDLTRKSRRVIPMDPIISPFDSREDKDLVPRDTL